MPIRIRPAAAAASVRKGSKADDPQMAGMGGKLTLATVEIRSHDGPFYRC